MPERQKNLHIEVQVEPYDENLRIEWYHNDKEVPMSNRINRFNGFGYSILEINDFDHNDIGNYVCVASNKNGYSKQSFNVAIVKNDDHVRPKFQSLVEEEIKVVEGQSIHVETTVIPHDIQLEWFHNGHSLLESSRIKTTSDFGCVVLEISRIEPRDSGEYLLVATNKNGIDTLKFTLFCEPTKNIDQSTKMEQNCNLIAGKNLKNPRFIRKIPEEIIVEEGQSIHIESQYEPFDGSIRIDFLRNGKPLIASERFRTINEFGFVVLDIIQCYEQDSGIYEIVLSSLNGRDSLKTKIYCQGSYD